MIYAVLDLLAACFSLLGAFFCLTAAVGLVRFPDLVTRMHPAAKPQSLGMVILLVGLALHIRTLSAALFLALVTILQMMTVTLSSHVVARTGYRSGLFEPDSLVADELADALASRRQGGDTRSSQATRSDRPRVVRRTEAGPAATVRDA